MPKSARLRVQDIRQIMTLVGECRELGDDATVWRLHWFAGVAQLIGAGLVLGGEVVDVRAGRTRYVGTTDWGWANGFNRLGWDRALAEMAADPSLMRVMSFGAYLQRMLVDDGASLARSDYLRDSYWYRSWEYENLPRTAGADHCLFCFHSLPRKTDEFHGLFLSRAMGDRDFSAREKVMVREAQRVLSPLVGGPLARYGEPSPSSLPKRGRQVLNCLLAGDSDKQIAARLGISRFTVNGHTKAIFRHFAVGGRAELQARWIRRGWGSTFRWADPE